VHRNAPNYFGRMGFALKKNLGQTIRRASSQKRCANLLDTGARGATVTFTSRGVGDILLA
jgi:sulfate/thiosulfate transport system substrate-binding protein